jgi:Na+/melibiose symporter-like transporter
MVATNSESCEVLWAAAVNSGGSAIVLRPPFESISTTWQEETCWFLISIRLLLSQTVPPVFSLFESLIINLYKKKKKKKKKVVKKVKKKKKKYKLTQRKYF